MRPETDLRLLRDHLKHLAETPYFSRRLHDYTDALVGAIDEALSSGASVMVLLKIADQIALAHEYLSGSTSREAPHEIKYALESIIPDWITRECLITTSLQNSRSGFHFQPIDPWKSITTILPSPNYTGFDAILILMGLPRIYKHKPIFCGPLFHELGHFIDHHLGVTNTTLLQNKVTYSALNPLPPPSYLEHIRRHRMEYFADLFSASYIGESSILALEEIAPGMAASFTHPSNQDRRKVIDNFLSSKTDPIVDMFQLALKTLGSPELKQRFINPDISDSYDDLRPYRIAATEEMFGLFNVSWTYLSNALENKTLPWSQNEISNEQIVGVVNDLTEKSIRNHAIKVKWENVTSRPS